MKHAIHSCDRWYDWGAVKVSVKQMPIASSRPQVANWDLCIPSLLGTTAERTPDGIAIAAPGRAPLTYGRLRLFVHEVCDALNEMAVGRSDRVAVVVPDGPEMAAAFVAVAASATCAPLNPAYRASEFDSYLTDLRPKALIIQSGIDSAVRAVARQRGIAVIDLEPRSTAEAGLFTLSAEKHRVSTKGGFAQPSDTALILYTSGTTARPKKVPLTHANICTSACSIAATLELDSRDRCLNVMPPYHIHGLIGAMLSTLVTGASIVCPPGFDQVAFFEWLEEFRPSWYTAVPTIHQAILSRAGEYADIIGRHPLRFIRSCSSPLPPQVMAELEHVFNAPVIEAYGMTEASHQITSNPLPPRIRKAGSVGTATGCEVVIMDEAGNLLPPGTVGEIVIGGPNVARGYESNLEVDRTAFINGQFRTGDQGFLDPDGYLFINGRLKEIINRGGTKISPREIEEVLLDHPGIAQVVVFGVPHNTLGEDIVAAVVLRKSMTATEEDIRHFAAIRLSDFRVPSRILIVDELPKGASGKLQRSHLADQFAPMLNAQFVAPRIPLEWQVAQTWANVLGVERVGVDDNFFELGGTSLSAVRMFAEVQKITGQNLPITTLLRAPTVKQLAKVLRQERGSVAWPSLVAIQPEGSRPPLFFMHGHGGYVLNYRHLARHLGADQPFYALQQQGLDEGHPTYARIEDMATHYVQEIRTFLPEGPYFLGGHSVGALVAYEVAQQLRAQDQNVALLVLINGYFPIAPKNSTSVGAEISYRLRKVEFHLDNFADLGLRGAPRYVIDGLSRRISRVAHQLFPFMPRRLLPAADSAPHASLPPALLEIQRINDQAARNYVPRPYRDLLTVFLSRRFSYRNEFRVPWWLAAGGMETHKVPGDHISMLEEPRVRILAKKLRTCLDKAMKSPGGAGTAPVVLGFHSPTHRGAESSSATVNVGRKGRPL